MRLRLLYTLLILGFLFSCESTSKSAENYQFESKDLALIPTPKEMNLTKGFLPLSSINGIEVQSPDLVPLGALVSNSLKTISNINLKVKQGESSENAIYIALDEELKENSYHISITNRVEIIAKDYTTAARAAASLIQIIQEKNKNLFVFPKLDIKDHTDYNYRSVMLDLARFWQPVETIKETIDLLWFYKINYLSLHLSDNRRFTFPLEKYPKLKSKDKNGKRTYYTRDELNDLVSYAKDRGVIIIPEVDLPGHSSALWNTYPEVFGHLNPETQKADPLYVVNIASEKTYDAINEIIKSLAEVFYTSPYLHIGGDEVYLEQIKKVPSYQEYTKKHGLTEASKGNVNELFCHFINRLNTMVKETGKKTIVWEGFHDTGAGNVTIDKDISVIVWNTTYNNPKNLLDNGYQIINSTWIPWYMVGAMNFAPSQERAYQWDVNTWSHWKDNIKDISLEKSPAILGGQISFWEQNYQDVLPVLQERVPVLSERLWSNTNSTTYEQFKSNFTKANSLYTMLFRPISIEPKGLLNDNDFTFTNAITLKLNASKKGTLRWVYADDWGIPDMSVAKAYSSPIEIQKSGVITAQLFDESGKKIGYPEQQYFQKITPFYNYKVFRPSNTKGWGEMPDFSKLTEIRKGVTGKMTHERLEKINGRLFAKVKELGHIDTRFEGLYNSYAVQLTGTLTIPKEDTYTFNLLTDDGLGSLYIDGKLIGAGKEFGKKLESFELNLDVGIHEFRIDYFYKEIQNQLNITYKNSVMNEAIPFEQLVNPLKN
ncbi:family 20 glycosylhydrolase [Aureibaculum sp. A20]|uniref:beta-N-acetylhexosaminidase n=1 Tax=Aureibaculum flavum TaxID=2795986 RepID=A0ABS0WVP5_9FLAO|nr:family 20 glycosylhydrolase [Aureibaculum flavum]MBJ2176059.1 family 20 glycosylhydrolase [Aureibaculum flavum]